MKLELYYSEYCPFCQLVLAKVKYLNIANHIILVNTQNDLEAAKRHFSITNRNTVPCLYIDGKPMFESADICNWLELNQSKIKG